MNGVIEFSTSSSEERSKSLHGNSVSRLFTFTISAKVNGIVVGSISACEGNMFNDIDDGWAVYDLQTDNKEYHYNKKSMSLGCQKVGRERNDIYPGLGTLLLEKMIDYLKTKTNRFAIQSLTTAVGFYEKSLYRLINKGSIKGYIRGEEEFNIFIR